MKQFKEYYVGRKGLYHNKIVTILSTNYDEIEYQDFGLNFDEFQISVYFPDSKKSEIIIGNQIIKNLKLFKEKK
jgi:hypothetical protein